MLVTKLVAAIFSFTLLGASATENANLRVKNGDDEKKEQRILNEEDARRLTTMSMSMPVPSSPVAYPVSSPVAYPVASPMSYPVASPVAAPMGSPSTAEPTGSPTAACCEECCTCECHARKEELEAEIEELNQHIAALDAAIDVMDGHIATLRDVQDAQLELFENFELKILGRCVIGGLDGLAVGKLLQVFKPLCVNGAFAAACVRTGAATTKEAIEFTLKEAGLQNAIIAWSSKTASIVAKATVQDSGWVKYIPIIGGACEAYNWSEAMMNAEQVIEMVGQQIIEAMKIKNQMKVLKKEKEEARDAKQAELDALNCGDCDEEQ